MSLVPPPMVLPGATVGQNPGQYIDVPYFLPVFKEPATGVVIPLTTPLRNGETVSIPFTTPKPQLGDFTMQGWWAWLVVPNPDVESRATAPLMFVEPNGGVFSASLPLPPPTPEFIGAQEGNRFRYVLQVSENLAVPINDVHSHSNYMINPLSVGPIRVPAGASCLLTVTREDCTQFFPFVSDDDPGIVYLMFGVFGTVRYNIPPAYDPSSCVAPVTVIEVTSGQVVVPSSPNLGRISAVTSVRLPINKKHPADIYQLRYAGSEHLMLKASWQNGLGAMTSDYIPARLFNRVITGGVLPQLIRVMAPTSLDLEVVMPVVVADQAEAEGRFSMGVGLYGY